MNWDLALILLGWGLAGGSPGPATLAISGTAMAQGRAAGVAVGAGVLAGSGFWGLASALGMGALMLSHAWIFLIVKYAGALYLAYLAVKALRSAFTNKPMIRPSGSDRGMKRHFTTGLLVHLTNPKAVLGWGAIYAIALPSGAGQADVFLAFAQLLTVSAVVFLGYGVIFSNAWLSERYLKARRVFEGVFGVLFGAASLRILTARVS